MSQRYLVGVHGKKTGQVIGPYADDEVQAVVKGTNLLRQEGAEDVYVVRADNHLEARRKASAQLK